MRFCGCWQLFQGVVVSDYVYIKTMQKAFLFTSFTAILAWESLDIQWNSLVSFFVQLECVRSLLFLHPLKVHSKSDFTYVLKPICFFIRSVHLIWLGKEWDRDGFWHWIMIYRIKLAFWVCFTPFYWHTRLQGFVTRCKAPYFGTVKGIKEGSCKYTGANLIIRMLFTVCY